MRKRRDVKDMKGALQEFLAQEGLQELGDLLRVKEAWADLVGEKTAGRSKPYRLEGGRLYVGVRSHAWAQELHYHVEEIKKGLKKETGLEIGEIVIKKINLR